MPESSSPFVQPTLHEAAFACVALLTFAAGCSESSGQGGVEGAGGNGFPAGTGAHGSTGAHSGGGGSGAGSGSGGGGASTCGNGQVDPGEDCEPDKLGGQTCQSLGFDSGSLSCTSTCSIDATGCVSAFSPAIVASRTACAAPCAVFFDGTSTTGLSEDDYVGAHFVWDFDATNVDPGGRHERALGFVAAHVFAVPGEYEVRLRVRDTEGNSGQTKITIDVGKMQGSTIHIAADGDDDNAGTVASPRKSIGAALAKADPGTSILLRRGDTFNVGSLSLSGPGPLLVGAYTDPDNASVEAPLLDASGDTAIDISGSDVRLVDVHLVADSEQGIRPSGSNHALIWNVEIEGTQNIAVGVDAAALTVADCWFHDFRAYGFYGKADRFASIGNRIERFGGGQHGMRIASGDRTYVAETTVSADLDDPDVTSESFTFRGDHGTTTNERIVFVGNVANRPVSFIPQNESEPERLSHVLVEGNVLDGQGILVTARDVMLRNNLLIDVEYTGISVDKHPLIPGDFVRDVRILNNTFAFGVGPDVDLGIDTTFVSVFPIQGFVLRNNVYMTKTTAEWSKFLSVSGAVSLEEDHNLLFAPNIQDDFHPYPNEMSLSQWQAAGQGEGSRIADPQFSSTGKAPDAFRPKASSAAIDKGADAPVYADFAGTPRPAGPHWDIGAFERIP